jgi:hypothetical protein
LASITNACVDEEDIQRVENNVNVGPPGPDARKCRIESEAQELEPGGLFTRNVQ